MFTKISKKSRIIHSISTEQFVVSEIWDMYVFQYICNIIIIILINTMGASWGRVFFVVEPVLTPTEGMERSNIALAYKRAALHSLMTGHRLYGDRK